ncbi:MAG: serine--tRNA ligase [Acidobacteria bacterium]|uniref:Serine--tRNA ligase n=1 Tax=Candidatus Polarisedimenticola svalbardensis TaxID=2886004 RepID=A0A8J6XYM2_9BACT|nr:serine--tRNA ligase [Candidatus Polarisedimenticola svalbardensis]
MLDPHFVRENLEAVTEAMASRGESLSMEPFQEMDRRRRDLLGEVEELKRHRNESSRKIGGLMKAGEDAGPLREEMRQVGEKISAIEEELGGIEEDLREFMLRVPNIPHETTPPGKTEEDNPVVRSWGEPREFSFEAKNHWDIGPDLGILDFERAAKLSGARFSILMGDGARLERALIQFMLDLQTGDHGYTEVLTPFMVNAAALTGTGQLPKFEENLFKVSPGDLYMIPTAEVPVTNIHAGEILDGDTLPLQYAAYTPCFRSEAGSYGKDVRGLIRQHQFNKVELVWLTKPENSQAALESLTAHAEEVLRRLQIPYRVIALCTGDIGFSAAKTYDVEVWLPGQKTYREISSCSDCSDFQARRAGIRYREEKKGKPRFVHTLNGSGLAVGRTLVAVLENYQQEDGTVVIPEVLRPYMGGKTKIER